MPCLSGHENRKKKRLGSLNLILQFIVLYIAQVDLLVRMAACVCVLINGFPHSVWHAILWSGKKPMMVHWLTEFSTGWLLQCTCSLWALKIILHRLIRITVFEDDGLCWFCIFFILLCNYRILFFFFLFVKVLLWCSAFIFFLMWRKSMSDLCHFSVPHLPARSTHQIVSVSDTCPRNPRVPLSISISPFFFAAMALAQAGSGLRDC